MTQSDVRGLGLILPFIYDRDSAGFWEAAERGELVLRVCKTAGHVLHLPRDYCDLCDSFEVEWRAVDGRGTVHTWTVVEHTVDPAYPAPYTVVLVELSDGSGVRFVTDLPGRVDLKVGTPMVVRFERLSDNVTLPRWVLE